MSADARQRGEVGKLQSSKLRGRADGRNVRACVTERRGSGRGRSREGVHVQCITPRNREGVHVKASTCSVPRLVTQRGQCIAGAFVRSRV
ncbi:unnamed protein product [Sphagnum balticum]